MRTINTSDEQLVSLYRAGDNSAFDILLKRYTSKIKRAIQAILSNPEDVNDIFQDLSIHISSKLKSTYNESGQFTGWLTCVVTNYMYSLCRKKKIFFSAVEIESLKEIESEYTLPPDIREQKYAALRKSVKELPEELKNLVELKIWKRMTLQAIADKLNMKKSTVAAKLKSAYQKIEKSMIDKGYDDGLI